jgi:hypothetical protein
MLQEACTQPMRGRSQRDGSEGPGPSDSAVPGRGVVLMHMQEDLLAPVFWLALGCALGWQDKECYAGENPAALLETMRSHVSTRSGQGASSCALQGKRR